MMAWQQATPTSRALVVNVVVLGAVFVVLASTETTNSSDEQPRAKR